jgi:hypothetical protein
VSEKHKQITLSRSEEKLLDDLADSNDFWCSIRAKYAEFDALTEAQYVLLRGEIERRAWQRGANRVAGQPVRNKFASKSGEPKCAHRTKPFCTEIATIVVGQWGYCAQHAPAAATALEAWRAERIAERQRTDVAPSPSPPQTKSVFAEYLDRLDAQDDDTSGFEP